MRSTPSDSDVPVVIPEWVAKHFREYGGRLRHTPPSLDPNAIPVRDTFDDPIVPGRGKTVPLSRQERRENMIYMDINNPDIYDLIDLINSWVARQRAMGATLPEETLVKQIFPEIMSKAASATTWLVGTGGSNGFLGGKFPEDSMLGRIIKIACYLQGCTEENLDWLHVLLELQFQICRRYGQRPSELQSQLINDFHFRKNLPGRSDPMIANESIMNYAERFYMAHSKIKRACKCHNANGTHHVLSTKMLQMAICKEADNFLGACDSSGRRYMDSVLLVMNSDEVVPHDRFIEILTKVWNVKCHYDAQLSSLSVQHDLISINSLPNAKRPRTLPPLPAPAPSTATAPATHSPGRGLFNACIVHGRHTNRSCRLTAHLSDVALLEHLRSLPKVSATEVNSFAAMSDEQYYSCSALTINPAIYTTAHTPSAVSAAAVLALPAPPAPSATTADGTTEAIVNTTGAQNRNRAVVQAHIPAEAPPTTTPAAPTATADLPKRLQDGSTACCNRVRCPGPQKCWWVNPGLCFNIPLIKKRYTNQLKYGAERAGFTDAVFTAFEQGKRVPTLEEYRRQHPEQKGTSSAREPYNTAYAYQSAAIEIPEDSYSVPPLTEDLL